MTSNGRRPQEHGGESAIAAVKSNDQFTGLAAIAEREVRTEFEELGRAEMVKRGALRLEACAKLFWDAIRMAVERQDIKALDRYVARFGWLQGAALRAWAQVRDEERDDPNELIIDAVNTAREAQGDANIESD